MAELSDPFTMTEYIADKRLGVNPHDTTATRTIAAHLRAKGYRNYRGRRGGKVMSLWTKHRNGMEALAEKLKKL